MNKSKTICTTVLLVSVFVCTRSMALDPNELLAIHRAHTAAMNAHDLDKMMSYWAEDGIYDLVPTPPPVPKAVVRAAFQARFAAYPDFHMTEGRDFATTKIVVVENETVRTHVAKGIKVVSPHLSIYEFEGDKIKKVISYKDNLSDMVQLGQMPPPDMPELVPSIKVPDPERTGLSPMEADAELVARWQSHDPAQPAKMCHSDFKVFAGPLGAKLDRVAITALNELYYQGFPDVQLETVRRIDIGNGWVLTELLTKATHQGLFMGVPASGYLAGIRVVWFTHYDADGLATEQSFYYDNTTLLKQLTTAPYSLDGIWVTTVPTPLGNLVMTTTYVAQDADRTRFSGSLEEINPMPLLADIYPGMDPNPKWAGGHAVMVGRDRYEATYLGYSTKTVETEIGKVVEFVGLFTIRAYFEVIGPDFLYGQGTGSYYMAAQDANRDGFPDEGEEPVVCIPWGWTSKRLTMMPGCVPTP